MREHLTARPSRRPLEQFYRASDSPRISTQVNGDVPTTVMRWTLIDRALPGQATIALMPLPRVIPLKVDGVEQPDTRLSVWDDSNHIARACVEFIVLELHGCIQPDGGGDHERGADQHHQHEHHAYPLR